MRSTAGGLPPAGGVGGTGSAGGAVGSGRSQPVAAPSRIRETGPPNETV